MPPQIRAVMGRRTFVVTIAGGVLAAPLAVFTGSRSGLLGLDGTGPPGLHRDGGLAESRWWGLV